ncbi:MAG TPA: ABC transporter ATP-binding protein [Candidatus Saccharimonadales bacterium]|nr:ABC transporter ATP-binding protein [Candidatus Saccharimonadales bacterium]
MSDLSSNKKIVTYYWRHALRYPLLLWSMIVTVPLALLFNQFLTTQITSTILQRLTTGDYVAHDIWGSFGKEIVLAIGSSILGGVIIWRINIYCNWKLESLVMRDIYQEVFNHLLRMSARFHTNSFGGSLVSQTSKLAGSYIRMTDTTMFQVSILFWSLVGTNVFLWSRAPQYVLVLDAFSIVYVIAAFKVTQHIRKLNTVEADADNKRTGELADAVTNVMAIKSFATALSEGKHFASTSEKARLATVNVMRASLRTQMVFSGIGTGIFSAAVILAIVSVMVYGAPADTVFLVFTYTTIISSSLWEFSSSALRNYNRAFGDAQAMTEILQMQPEIKDPIHPEKVRMHKGSIDFANMSFSHDESADTDGLFQGLNLHIAAGEKIGLVGHSGSGKTTLTKLLLRFNDLDEGEIRIDDQNIAAVTQDDLRSRIAYIPQEPLLFHRSIRENIAYGKPGATDKEVREAAKKAYADEFIDKLPEGYKTLVGERGVKLSGGQRQRIVIARAILKDAPILVLDEATSALDSESEKYIQAALMQLMQHRTAIVIAHRLSTVQKMDRIIVLGDGAIVEEGTHQELIARPQGTYARLWAHQSGGFLED